LLAFVALAVLVVLTYCTLFLNRDAVDAFILEDAIFESAGAAGVLLAAVFMFIVFLRARRAGKGRVYQASALVLTLIFFVGGMEEISWGQRIFGLETPQELKEINRQEELTAHNLEPVGGKANLIFNLFWFGFGLLLPLAAVASRRLGAFLHRVVPIVPLWVGALLALNYALSKIARASLGDIYEGTQPLHRAAIEIKEADAQLLFAVGALCVLREYRKRVDRPRPLPASEAGSRERPRVPAGTA
jgi:hypothetical protein